MSAKILNAEIPNTEEINSEETNAERTNSKKINSEKINAEEINSEKINAEKIDAEGADSEETNSTKIIAEEINFEEINADLVENSDEELSNDTEKLCDDQKEDVSTTHDDLTNSDHFSLKNRNKFFEKGAALYKKGKTDDALKCFLMCLKGLESSSEFYYLPKCLRNVADIYFEKGEYENAVQFVQAEKIFYEASLIDSSVRQQIIAKSSGNLDAGQDPIKSVNEKKLNIIRADEYQHLAEMCLEKCQPQLALEYQGKATKLRQETLGPQDLATLKSLDFFTVIYGEVGKKQYSDSLEQLDIKASPVSTHNHTAPNSINGTQTETKDFNEEEKLEDNSNLNVDLGMKEQSLPSQPPVSIPASLLWVSLVVCLFSLSLLVFYFYCLIDLHYPLCIAWKTEIDYRAAQIWDYVKLLFSPFLNT